MKGKDSREGKKVEKLEGTKVGKWSGEGFGILKIEGKVMREGNF